MDYYVFVQTVSENGTWELLLPADGSVHTRFNAIKISEDTYRLEYGYQYFPIGGSDHRKEIKTITIELHPNQIIETDVTQTNWIYGRGSYNTPAKLIARLVDDEEAYQTVKTRDPSYQYGRLLLTLGKTDEFKKMLDKINEPNDGFWSIHRAGQFEMLSLAYGKAAGRPKDRRKAILNALRGQDIAAIFHYLEKGYLEDTIPSREFLIGALVGEKSNADDYLFGMALIGEGFVEAGEKRILWGANNIAWNAPEFYAPGNSTPRYYQSCLHKKAAEIYFDRGEDSDAILNYGAHLAYERFGDDRMIHYTKVLRDSDPDKPNNTFVQNISDMEMAARLVKEAADGGDEFAKKLVSVMPE